MKLWPGATSRQLLRIVRGQLEAAHERCDTQKAHAERWREEATRLRQQNHESNQQVRRLEEAARDIEVHVDLIWDGPQGARVMFQSLARLSGHQPIEVPSNWLAVGDPGMQNRVRVEVRRRFA